MKVVHWISFNSWGGAERLFYDCCVEMSMHGHSLLAVVPSGSVLHTKLLNHENSLYLVPLRRYFQKFRWWTIRKFKRKLRKFDPNILILHSELPVRLKGKINFPDKRNYPIVLFVPFPLHGVTSGVADAIIPHTETQATVDYHEEMVESKFTEVVPVFSRFTPVERIYRKSHIKNLIAVGRLVPEKGFNYLIEAMQELTSIGHELTLRIVGIGPEKKNLIRQRDALNLNEVVQFMGESHQIDRLMQQADLFVLPSVTEPFGIVLLEAMASGLPIVATRTHGPNEIFDKSSAVLVESESAVALSEGIKYTIQDLDATYQRARIALDQYKRYYTAEVVIPKFNKVFEHCIERKSITY